MAYEIFNIKGLVIKNNIIVSVSFKKIRIN